MNSRFNKILQTIASISQVVNVEYIPQKYQLPVALSLGALQGFVGSLAHYYNPDGTKIEKK